MMEPAASFTTESGLGSSTNCSGAENAAALDPSILQRPVNIGVRNIQQILRCLQNGNEEVRDLIFNECRIIYECKVCSNLFRSLANFLAHKRFYCMEQSSEHTNRYQGEEAQMVVLQPEKPAENTETGQEGTKHSDAHTRLNAEKYACPDSPSMILPFFSVGSSSNSDRDEDPNNNFQRTNEKPLTHELKKEVLIELKSIAGNPNAVFQQVSSNNMPSSQMKQDRKYMNEGATDSMDAEGPSIRIIIPNKNGEASPSLLTNAASLTRKKRLESRKDCDVGKLKCLKCLTTYTSIKTLYLHMMTIHAQKRLFYPCLYCSASFVQVWGVVRHIITAHQKSKEQVSKLREIIRRRAFMKKMDSASQKNCSMGQGSTKKIGTSCKSQVSTGKDSSLHGCGKCGRMFARKSSQITHEKFCKGGSAAAMSKAHTALRSSAHNSSNAGASNRPKRLTEKKVPKDFVNSQTLKWRSANKVEMPNRGEKGSLAEREKLRREIDASVPKKVMSLINREKLICLKCSRRFFSASNLLRHVAIHVGWTRYKCKHCSFRCYTKADCRNHIQRTHVAKDTPLANIDKQIVDLPLLGSSGSKAEETQKKKSSPTLRSSSPAKQGSPVKSKHNKSCHAQQGERKKSSLGEKDASHTISCTPFIITARKSGSSLKQVSSKQMPTGMQAGSPSSKGHETNCIVTRHSARSTDKSSLTTLVTRSGTYPKVRLIPINVYQSARNKVKRMACDSARQSVGHASSEPEKKS